MKMLQCLQCKKAYNCNKKHTKKQKTHFVMAN